MGDNNAMNNNICNIFEQKAAFSANPHIAPTPVNCFKATYIKQPRELDFHSAWESNP